MKVVSDRRYVFAAERCALWDALHAVPAYTSWWPRLTEFDGRVLAVGETWRCGVRSPLLTVLRFQISIDHVVEHEQVVGVLSGDLDGTATLRLREHADGTEVRLVSALSPRSRVVTLVATVAPPLARWAHDRVIDTAAQQFPPALHVP
jgi:hypothetical protein